MGVVKRILFILLVLKCLWAYNKEYQQMLWEGFENTPMVYVAFKQEGDLSKLFLTLTIDNVEYNLELQVFYDEDLYSFMWKDKKYFLDLNHETYYFDGSIIERRVWKIIDIYKEKEKGLEYLIIIQSKAGRRLFMNRDGQWFNISIAKNSTVITLENYPLKIEKLSYYMPAIFNPIQGFILIDYTLNGKPFRKVIDYIKTKRPE